MKKQSILALMVAILAFFSYASQNTSAAELITNGGFETGTFAGWTITNASGSWMNWTNSAAGAGGTFNPPYYTAPQQGTRDVWNGITATANQQYTMTQDVTIPSASTASFSWKDRVQMNLSDFCNSAATCGQAFYFVEILNTSNTLFQTLYTVTAPSLTKTDTGWKTHYVRLDSYSGQTIRIRFRDYGTVTFAGPGQAEIDAVSLSAPAVPSAANVSIGGRVTTSFGYGIGNASVTLTDSHGAIKTARTTPFGYYVFDGVEAGETCVIGVSVKGYTFTPPTQVVSATDNLQDLNFVADN